MRNGRKVERMNGPVGEGEAKFRTEVLRKRKKDEKKKKRRLEPTRTPTPEIIRRTRHRIFYATRDRSFSGRKYDSKALKRRKVVSEEGMPTMR